jgi:hypothetical protein
MVDVAMSCVLPWSSTLSREVTSTTTVEADETWRRLQESVVQAGVAHAVVVVEPSVLPASVGVDVGGRPTAAAELDEESNADADVDETGWWGEKDAPFSTLGKHYRMGLP